MDEIISSDLLYQSNLQNMVHRFLLRISSVNVTKSAGNCGFGHIYWKNP